MPAECISFVDVCLDDQCKPLAQGASTALNGVCEDACACCVAQLLHVVRDVPRHIEQLHAPVALRGQEGVHELWKGIEGFWACLDLWCLIGALHD